MSEAYRRRRRLAILIAVLSVAFLVVGGYFGYFLETYSRPSLGPASEGWILLHSARAAGDDVERSTVLLLSPTLPARSKLRLLGECRGAVPEGEDLLLLYPKRYSVIRAGQSLRGADLDQAWEVRSASRDDQGDVWLFGVHEGHIVYRRKSGRLVSETQRALEVRGDLEDLTATGGAIHLVWRVRGTGRFRAARWTGSRFEPFAEVSVPAGEPAAATVVGRRLVAVSQRREDREFLRVHLRLTCCAECGLPQPPGRLSFRDPVLLLGRKVTGLALAPRGDEIGIAVTRATTVQVGRLSAEGLRPQHGHLVSVSSEPMWRRTVAALWPALMLFFSFSLIFLGFTLMRERRRFFLEHLAAEARRMPDGTMPAEILQRALAHILDFLVLLPVFFVCVELLSLAPETREIDWSDPLALGMVGLYAGLQFLYTFSLEWAFGRTLGKRAIGIRVCRIDGSRVGFRGALLRNLLRIFDATFVLAIVGVAFMVITSRRRRLGDIVAGTMVVEDSAEGRRPSPPS